MKGGEERTSRSIEVAQIQRMRVVCLPRGEEHGKHRNQRGEGANLCASIAHSCRFEERRQSAVQRVYTMAKVLQSVS